MKSSEFLRRKSTFLISISPSASSDLEANLVRGPIKHLEEEKKILPIDKPFVTNTIKAIKERLDIARDNMYSTPPF